MKVTDRLPESVQTVFGTCNENYCGELYPSLRMAPQIGSVTKTTSDPLEEVCQAIADLCAGCLKALRFWCREPWHFSRRQRRGHIQARHPDPRVRHAIIHVEAIGRPNVVATIDAGGKHHVIDDTTQFQGALGNEYSIR